MKKNNKYNAIQKKWSEQIFDKYNNDIIQLIMVESGHHIHIQKSNAVLNALDDFISKLIIN